MATISITKSALFELIMAALEAYAIKHDRESKVAIETFAHLWGSHNKRLPFKCNVEHISVETSAKRRRDSVSTQYISLDLKKDIARVFGEGYNHLGNFHTHPYFKNEDKKNNKYTANKIRTKKLFNFSDQDHRSEINEPIIEVGKHSFSVALVMTVFAMERADDRSDGYIESNLYELSLGNIKLWLKAQVFEHKEKSCLTDYELNDFSMYGLDASDYNNYDTLPVPITTDINCDFLPLGTYLEGFGRLVIDDKEAVYINTELAEKRFCHSV
ncbi:TPA: hypothetical protein ACX6R1_000753 [Photobacterium damselae]